MKNYIIILLSSSIFFFTVCKKKHKEEDLYGTWEESFERTGTGSTCPLGGYSLKKVQIEFVKNATAYLNYYKIDDSLYWPIPCQISWSLEKEKKDYYLLMQYPDSCLCGGCAGGIASAKYKIDYWEENKLYIICKSYSGYSVYDEIFCSTRWGGSFDQIHLIKIK